MQPFYTIQITSTLTPPYLFPYTYSSLPRANAIARASVHRVVREGQGLVHKESLEDGCYYAKVRVERARGELAGYEVEIPAIESIRVAKVLAVTEEDLDTDFEKGDEGVLGYAEEWGTGEEGMKEVDELLRGLGVGLQEAAEEQRRREKGQKKKAEDAKVVESNVPDDKPVGDLGGAPARGESIWGEKQESVEAEPGWWETI